MTGSFYGKFFARNLNLYLLQRNPEQWKTIQTNSKSVGSSQELSIDKQSHSQTNSAQAIEATKEVHGREKKRKARSEDEIDQLFQEKLGKKIKKAGLATATPANTLLTRKDEVKSKKQRSKDGDGKDNHLEAIFGAIKAAPKDDGSRRGKKKK